MSEFMNMIDSGQYDYVLIVIAMIVAIVMSMPTQIRDHHHNAEQSNAPQGKY